MKRHPLSPRHARIGYRDRLVDLILIGIGAAGGIGAFHFLSLAIQLFTR